MLQAHVQVSRWNLNGTRYWPCNEVNFWAARALPSQTYSFCLLCKNDLKKRIKYFIELSLKYSIEYPDANMRIPYDISTNF